MIRFSHRPAPPLSEFVRDLWTCSDTPSHARERILPSGTIELVINLRDDELRIDDPSHPGRSRRYSGAIVSGTYRRAFVIDPSQHASIIGVHFKPGGAREVLGIDADELAELHIDLDAVWETSAAQLRERLCAATTPRERFAIIERTLLDRLRRTKRDRHPAVPIALAMLEQPASCSLIREVTKRLHLSQRRFIQLFTREVGLTPKLFARILRFQRALELAARSPTINWANIAASAGYFDQSHLIHDFREFSGLTPSDYQRQRSENVMPNHVPIIA